LDADHPKCGVLIPRLITDDLQHGDGAFSPFLPRRRLERYGGIAKCPLGAHDALGNGGFRKQEGARAISGAVSPPSKRKARAARCSAGRTGWQAVKINRSGGDGYSKQEYLSIFVAADSPSHTAAPHPS
jgi:hypothetical protein